MSTKEKVDVYEIVKENILKRIEEMDAGQVDGRWVKPWSLQTVRPMNWHSQRLYSGVNLFLLNHCGSEFLTWNQIKELQQTKKQQNVQLRKGSKSHMVIYFKMLEKEDEDGEITIMPVLRYYRVFSLDDISGLELKRTVATYEHNPEESETALNDALTAYFQREGIPVRMTKSDGCYYVPASHSITIPEERYFQHFNEYLSSLAHETVHSTAAHMGRKIDFDMNGENYAYEELIAEFAASLLLAHFGVANEISSQNSAAYLHNWMQRIKDTPARKLVSAMTSAQKAVDFILGVENEE